MANHDRHVFNNTFDRTQRLIVMVVALRFFPVRRSETTTRLPPPTSSSPTNTYGSGATIRNAMLAPLAKAASGVGFPPSLWDGVHASWATRGRRPHRRGAKRTSTISNSSIDPHTPPTSPPKPSTQRHPDVQLKGACEVVECRLRHEDGNLNR